MGTSPSKATGARPANVLVAIGGDRVYTDSASGRSRIIGLSDVDGLLPDGLAIQRLNLTRDLQPLLAMLKQQEGGGDLSAFDCVLNLVCEPEHSPRTLEALGLLLRGFGGRVINRPDIVLRSSRDAVANAMSGIPGLLVPRVLRFRGGEPDAAVEAVHAARLSFPLIIRHTASHRGRTMVLVEDEARLRSEVAEERDYFAIEFVDYCSADGLYRKYRIWSFGGRQVFRHLAVTEHWMVHVTPGNELMIDRPDLLEEEQRLMKRPEGAFPAQVHAVMAEIGTRLGLDYFGVDFGFLPDGRMVLFEANAAMSYFPMVPHPRFEFRRSLLAPAQDAVRAMLGLEI